MKTNDEHQLTLLRISLKSLYLFPRSLYYFLRLCLLLSQMNYYTHKKQFGSQFLRSELITLTEKHQIKHSIAYIKKANYIALEKIKAEYERKQLQETNEYLSESLMEKLSEFMEGANMIDNAKSMEEELLHNKMVKRDLKNILGYVTPYIPLIGLVCGLTIVGKHMCNRKTETNEETQQQ